MTSVTEAESGVDLILKGLASIHEYHSPPDVDQRTAAWWYGATDEELAYAMGMACRIAREPVADALYLAHVADDKSQFRRIKDWAYGAAAEFACSRGDGVRRRVRVEGYRPEWGRVAARDGIARALWPEIADEVPGVNKRCDALGVGHVPFLRVRDAVENRAAQARADFRADLENLISGRVTRDMQDRITGMANEA